MPDAKPVLQVYGRPYCSLCMEMMAALQSLQPQYGFRLTWIDVDDDPSLEARFGERVPVLMANDTELCHYHLDRTKLDALFSELG